MLAVGAVLISLAWPGGSDAKQFKIPPSRVSDLMLRGSNGYRITIEQSRGQVTLTAGTGHSSATYFAAAPTKSSTARLNNSGCSQ